MELPAGWATATLGEVAAWGSGGTPKAGVSAYYGGGIPWAVIGDLSDGPLNETASTLTEAGLANSSAKWAPAGAVLIAMYGSIGKLGTAERSVTTNQAIAFATPDDRVMNRKFLFWYLRSQRAELLRAGKGGTQQNISQTVLKAWPVPVPPLAEQHRIVEALEGHLSRLDAAAQLVEGSGRRLSILADSVVSAALKEVNVFPFEPLERLLCEPLRNGHSARVTADSDGVRTLNLTAVTLNDFRDENTKVTSADPARVKGLWLEPGDILIQRSNTPDLVGTTAIFDGPRDWAIFPDLLIRVRVGSRLDPEFAAMVLRSKSARAYFKSKAKGLAGSMPKIDQAVIANFQMPVPPIEEQKRLVAEAAGKGDAISHVRSQLSRQGLRAVSLRNGLLRQAFNGALAPQDPTDEPATALLARVQAERAAQPKAKRARRTPAAPRKAKAPAAAPTEPAPAPSPAPTHAVQQEFDL
ncbi:restriction endonuclease subunit S [Streptomyces sp. NPDC006641]|uniref:restriction endonuclease subunit S n=1 Tax=unclassified Streptomyces TaxID=2593676 RepID=UPI002E776C87|nr:restriction endonuclease subunit S [Streptomyces sp. JV184]MEE1745421.1 restriction endonuclease subunit S [Streptomyces sp. JV184]